MNKEDIINELRKNGYRITEKRKLLINIILANEYSCCKEIYYEASKMDQTIGIATVYRMLDTLEDIGVINKNSYFKVPEEYIDCLKCNCKLILKNKKTYDINEKTWKQAISMALSSIFPIRSKDIDILLISKPLSNTIEE